MTSPEFIQSATQFAHQLDEARTILADPNFLHTLQGLGHPYALLLGQTNSPINLAEPSSQKSSRIIVDFEQGQGLKNPMKTRETLESKLPFQFSSFGYISSAYSAGHKESWNSSGVPLSDDRVGSISKTNENWLTYSSLFTVASSYLYLGIDKLNQYLANKQNHKQNLFLAPLFLKALAGEKTSLERSRELQVGKNSVSLGTTAIKLATYQGREPFVVKTPQGEPIAQINPGDQLGHLHVSHQAALMRGLSPLGKAEQITQDFMALFKAVENGDENLNSKQQEVLVKAQNATLIGISHLVRLFRRKTGLPTWKLDVLPELVQKFHQHDSQAVSTAFGGTRKVKPNDVEMMVITPKMRQALVTA